jgi:hypothetical protein
LEECVQSLQRLPLPLEQITHDILYGSHHTQSKSHPAIANMSLGYLKGRKAKVPKLWAEFGVKEGDQQGLVTLYYSMLERDEDYETLLRSSGSDLAPLADAVWLA